MIIKEEVTKNCSECGRIKERVSEPVYGCDGCKKPIASPYKLNNRGNHDFLQLRVFHKENETETYHLCSWKCVIKVLKKVKTNYFVDLPFLHYDQQIKGQTVKDFLALLKK